MIRKQDPAELNRRHFLAAAGAGLASLGLPMEATAAGHGIEGKHRRLVTLVEKPAVLETPLDLLGEKRITPTKILFVRNNQQPDDAATLAPAAIKGWKVELAGELSKSLSLELEDLRELPRVEVEMILQCSGNGRSLFSKAAMTSGTQWSRGGVGNVRFGGVRLADVLKKYGVRPRGRARFVTAEGRDGPEPGKEDFEHSLPLADVLEHSLLALRLNGEPLPAIHGGPVRLVTPGYYATMHLKWLSRLRFEAKESTNHNHLPRYRTPRSPIKPGAEIEYTLNNSTPTWRMKVATLIFTPAAGAEVPAKGFTVRGASFNDGSARIKAVELSYDRGKTWRRVRFETPKSPYAWYTWSDTPALRPGKVSVWARAVDALGRSQPDDGAIFWNPSGYEWNGVEKIDVTLV
jgi:sulfite oxidase